MSTRAARRKQIRDGGRKVIRKLTDEEWATLEPWLVRRQKAEAFVGNAVEALRDINRTVASLAAMAAGGTEDDVKLDLATRELYREIAPGKGK